jgi:hypothetical protein
MPYRNKSLALVWLMAFALFFLAGSGVFVGAWLLLLLTIALAAPAFLLRTPALSGSVSHQRPRLVPDERDRSLGLGGMDVYKREDEGGAGRKDVSGGIREAVHATS